MDTQKFSEKSVVLTNISPYVYGTARLGDETIPFNDRIEIAKAAIDTGVWFHACQQFGNAMDVLRNAFNYDRSKVPQLIVRIGGESLEQLMNDIEKNTSQLGIDSIDLGQLSLGGELAHDYANGGSCFKTFEDLKKSGRVKRIVMEVFPWSSETAYQALKNGFSDGIIDGYIFHLNPLQRFVSNALWDMLMERYEPIIAMRTVAGGSVHRMGNGSGLVQKDYLLKRAAEIAPIFERSGVDNWTTFCVRFAHSFTPVRATIGSTAKAENLQEFLQATDNIEPLPYNIMDEIVKLQYRWSDELDSKAEPWSM